MRKKQKIFSIEDLLKLKDDPNRWIIPHMIPKASKVMLYGAPAQFKSTIVFDLCVAVASGSMLCNQFEIKEHGPVLLISTEGSALDCKDRILSHARAHAADPSKMQLFFSHDPFSLDDALDIKALEDEMKRIKPLIIVLDPLDSCFTADENSATETKKFRREIDRLAATYQCTFIIIHHESKKGEEPRGSGAWVGWIDTGIRCFRKQKKVKGLKEKIDLVEVVAKKQRNGRQGHIFTAVPTYDTRIKQTTFSFYNGKDTDHIVKEHYKRECYVVLLRAKSPLTLSDIAHILDIKSAMAKEALQTLKTEDLATDCAKVERSCGTKNTSKRAIQAWIATKKPTTIDRAIYMANIEEQMRDEVMGEAMMSPVTDPDYSLFNLGKTLGEMKITID